METPPDKLLNGKSILITGGTGSFGKAFVRTVLERYNPRRLIVYSRDELKQFEMQQLYSPQNYPCLRYFLGDVRDLQRLKLALRGVQIVFHAAAIKHVTAAEYNPTECISTNIIGAENIINGAILNNVEKVIAISTDKAANPINLYGATKLCSDKLFVAANNLAGKHKTRFAVVRYGNVIGSRGSVIPYFEKLIQEGKTKLPLTHVDMTRFVITLDQGVLFVLRVIDKMYGGEIFIPKLPSIKIIDLIQILAGKGNYDLIGIRPGEKLHEVMIPKEESFNCVDFDDHYVITPMFTWWDDKNFKKNVGVKGKKVSESFEYSSDKNSQWVDLNQIKELISIIK